MYLQSGSKYEYESICMSYIVVYIVWIVYGVSFISMVDIDHLLILKTQTMQKPYAAHTTQLMYGVNSSW